MYFETGQGSALSAGAHHGVDQQTCEARAYAVARRFSPLLVNTVVGFIGPEYLYDGKQIIRAGLEDHFCGKLLGLPMGCDVCYTNHAEADQNDMDTLLTLLAVAGCNYVMGVPGADDVMLELPVHQLPRQPLTSGRCWACGRRRSSRRGWRRCGVMRRVEGRPRLLPVTAGHRLLGGGPEARRRRARRPGPQGHKPGRTVRGRARCSAGLRSIGCRGVGRRVRGDQHAVAHVSGVVGETRPV